MVKVPFAADEGNGLGREFLWLADVRYGDGVYSGTVASRPFYIEGLERGARVSFEAADIADWMYLRDGRIVGGRSVKYLIEMTGEIDRGGGMAELLNLFEPE
jgi:uncharacterized protein YegJ (DUF2314 family)